MRAISESGPAGSLRMEMKLSQVEAVKFSVGVCQIMLLSFVADLSCKVYDLPTDRRTVKITAHNQDVNSCCWADTASGNVLVSGSDDTFIKVWYAVSTLPHTCNAYLWSGTAVLLALRGNLLGYWSAIRRELRMSLQKAMAAISSPMERTKH